MDHEGLSRWIASYERAWRTPGTDGLVDLFTEDAFYSTGPYETPHQGLEAIGRMWGAERLGPDEAFELRWEAVAIEGDTGVLRVLVDYGPPREKEYKDLWIVRLGADERCSHFEEWPFWPPGQEGAPAAGA